MMDSIDVIISLIREENRDFVLTSLRECTVIPYTLYEGEWEA